MSEPLTEEQLQLARKLSGMLRGEGRLGAANLVVALLAEVTRLKAERNTLAAYLKITDRSVKEIMNRIKELEAT